MDQTHQASPVDRRPGSPSWWRSSPTTTSPSRRSSSSASSCPRSSCTRSRTAGWRTCFGDDTAKRAGRLTLNPVAAHRPVRHAHRAGAAVAGRRRRLRLGQAGARERVAPAQPAQPGRAGVAWPGRPRTSCSPPSSASSSYSLSAPGCRPASRRCRSRRPAPRSSSSPAWSTSGCASSTSIPIPPLDGSVVFERLLPARYWPTYLRYRQYTMPILLALVLLNFFLAPARARSRGSSTSSTAGGRACSGCRGQAPSAPASSPMAVGRPGVGGRRHRRGPGRAPARTPST